LLRSKATYESEGRSIDEMSESCREKCVESFRSLASRIDESFEENRSHILDLGVADDL